MRWLSIFMVLVTIIITVMGTITHMTMAIPTASTNTSAIRTGHAR